MVIFETLLKSTKITLRTSVSISWNEVTFMHWGEGWNIIPSQLLHVELEGRSSTNWDFTKQTSSFCISAIKFAYWNNMTTNESNTWNFRLLLESVRQDHRLHHLSEVVQIIKNFILPWWSDIFIINLNHFINLFSFGASVYVPLI